MTIAPLPQGTTTFIGLTGETLAGGKVFTYAAGTSTPMATWQDPLQSALNTNPVLLNANGQAVIYGWGAYRLLVEDSSGNTISDSITWGGPLTQTAVVFNTPGATGNFTVPAGVYTLYVEAVGGGGGGGNCFAVAVNNGVSGAGGGAGGFARGSYTVTPGQVIAYAIGTRGGPQVSGGATTFGSFITCNGGVGAVFTLSNTTSVGGIGGSASGGTIENNTGGSGTDGEHSGSYNLVSCGNGGASRYGAGGTSVNGATANNGVAPGSGGGGAMDVNITSTHFFGGTGATGQIIILYWA